MTTVSSTLTPKPVSITSQGNNGYLLKYGSTEHPFPWARFPDIGSFSGWKIVNILGKLCYEETLRLG